jgi:hypothetical protein
MSSLSLSLSVSQMALPQLQAAFLSMRPRIVRHASIYFRDVRCLQQRADCIAEVVGLCWMWFRRLAQRGKDARHFVSTLATYAARAVRCGGRVCGQLKIKDVLSEWAQQRHGFRVESLPTSTRTSHEFSYGTVHGQRRLDTFEERFQDNTQTPVVEQVCFRIDWPTWLKTRTERDQRIIEDMARDERTLDIAHKYNISPARVSQLRREYHDDWQRFSSEPGEADAGK